MMGSLRVKQGSYIEILKAIQAGALQGLTRPDRLLASQIWNTLNKMEYDPDLKLYLPFDEISGSTVHDLSGNGNTGTATGTTIVDGVFGKARSFDGIDDTIVVNDAASLDMGTRDWTIEWWMKLDTLPSEVGVDCYILHKYATKGYYVYLRNSDNRLRPVLPRSTEASTAWMSEISLEKYKWYHVVCTVDRDVSDGSKLYVNGKFESSADPTSLQGEDISDAADLQINKNGNMDGIVDEVRIYSRALTADEIYLHYLAGALKLGLI